MKEKELRGQLEEGGIGFWLREKQDTGKFPNGEPLLATDCKFTHIYHDSLGLANEKVPRLDRNFDRNMKLHNDFGYDCSKTGVRIFSFGSK